MEIIAGEATADETIGALSDLAAQMGKAPIVARRDVPGFVWNRLQHALLREALWLVDQQVADIATVDAAVSDGLAPRWLAVGPFATVDLGGMDTWSRVATEIFPHLASDPGLAAALDEHARSGSAFYEWGAGAQADVADLRSRTIEMSREVNVERRRLTPAARPGGTLRELGDGGYGQAPLAQARQALRSIADALDARPLPEDIARTSGQLRLLAARYEDAGGGGTGTREQPGC